MEAKSQRPKGREDAISALNTAIESLKLAKNISSITPAKTVFDFIGTLLIMIRDSMVDELDCVELGLFCADVCQVLDRGTTGKKPDELSRPVYDAINLLTSTVVAIQKKLVKWGKRNAISRRFHARGDRKTIVTWKLDLDKILQDFNKEFTINTRLTIPTIRHYVTNTLTATQTQISIPGESPPPAPRACFGRGELIERIVGLAEHLTPVALVGAGGIGKTSIALTVLHHDRIKRRFIANRRFIRCDQFPASCAHLLSRLSKAIGAGIENPEDLASLRSFLTSREILIVLDNAESILDPEGPDAAEIYAVVEELSQLENICLCITSRISAILPDCEILDVPTLSIDAACDAFYRIYKNAERSNLVDNILDQLDFHPLSITLFVTVAHQNKWGTDRLTREWERQRTSMLQTIHNRSLAATIELSLASPMFQELGPDARALLEVIAFFPRGIDENNLDWLFPTVSNGTNILDEFCVLFLAYRSDSFITMLAPLRDHLRLKDPKSSPPLCMTKERYFTRISVSFNPNGPGFGESRWIMSEDVNVEHLLDVFTAIDTNPDSVWDACANFMLHLIHHKNRLTILRLPHGHRSKPKCLFGLARLLQSIGNHVERKLLLIHALKLSRERGNDRAVARMLSHLSDVNRLLNLHEEGIQQVEEASEIFKRLSDTVAQAECLIFLARSLYSNKQLDAAEETASRAIDLLSEKGEQYYVCESHRLSHIYYSKGETEETIHHLEVALGIASSFNWHDLLFLVLYTMADLFLEEGRFDDAQAHLGRAKSYAVNYTHYLGLAMRLQARLWYTQHRLEEARAEVLRAVDVFEKLGAAKDLAVSRGLLRQIEEEMNKPVIPDRSTDTVSRLE